MEGLIGGGIEMVRGLRLAVSAGRSYVDLYLCSCLCRALIFVNGDVDRDPYRGVFHVHQTVVFPGLDSGLYTRLHHLGGSSPVPWSHRLYPGSASFPDDACSARHFETDAGLRGPDESDHVALSCYPSLPHLNLCPSYQRHPLSFSSSPSSFPPFSPLSPTPSSPSPAPLPPSSYPSPTP